MAADVVMRTFGGMTIHNLTKLNIGVFVDALLIDEHVILEHENEAGANVHYIQVRHRSEGDYQLEYRAGSPAEHYQTHTDSRAKVVDALFAWSKGEVAWRDEFAWKSIGDWFTEQ
ncbi:hypothetical protein [Amycolatopsis solani]|uniref:hypothetical protein n=1 Tax=Amycolatopsis solani TaxID=3028615 RepID=UPI0025B01A56|nr:hypothetical protein [Amycolatopsis sp. MEP2-6]